MASTVAIVKKLQASYRPPLKLDKKQPSRNIEGDIQSLVASEEIAMDLKNFLAQHDNDEAGLNTIL